MAAETRTNVLLIMVDSLRPDRIGCGGLPRAMTPNLDRLASSGAFVYDFFCPMPSSVPSRASIFTGRYPHAHGVRTNDYPLPTSEVTLAEVLSRNGYSTAGVPRLDPGLERGFSLLEPLGAPRETAGSTPQELAYHTTLVTDAAERALGALSGRDPWFLWVDYESTHEPWRPPEPYRSLFTEGFLEEGDDSRLMMYEPSASEDRIRRMRAMYDGEVAMVDKQIGRLLAWIEGQGGTESTMVLVLSDHGVFLGERGFFKKPPFLFDPLIRCTFIASMPGVIPAGTRPSTFGHICDVMPTVLDLLGLGVPGVCHGKSLSPVLRGIQELPERPAFVEFCEYRGTAVKAVRRRSWKYIHNASMGHLPWSGDYSPGEVADRIGLGKEMLFDLARDRDEVENVAGEHPDVVSDMKSLLIDWMVQTEAGRLPEKD